MKRYRNFLLGAIAGSASLMGAQAVAQAPTVAGITVHGHIINAAGQPFNAAGAEVRITKDRTAEYKDEKFTNTTKVNPDGTYTLTGVQPGNYYFYIIADNKTVDRLDLLVKPADTDLTLNDDMTRAEFINQMTPEQKKDLEDFKKKNAEAVSANAVIANLNATLKKVRTDLDAAKPTKGDVSADVTDMKSAVAAKPDEGILWFNYGDVLLAQSDHMAAADKAAGKPATSDDDLQKEYGEAIDAYKKAIDLDAASKKPAPAIQAAAYNQEANALAHSGKPTDAAAAFESAAKIDPTKAGMYYKNEAAVLTNANLFDQVVPAADKAIAADPKEPLPYYLKGQALVTKSTVDPKTQKLTPPPGCVEAYQMYLQLAPNGPYAAAVKELLGQLGEKIESKYKAK